MHAGSLWLKLTVLSPTSVRVQYSRS